MDMNITERDLRDRQVKRLVDIGMGRDDGSTVECHYLVLQRFKPGAHIADREIEQYRDLERVIANAVDCESGDRHAKCLGAFSATFVNGKLASVSMVENFAVKVASARHNKLDKVRVRNVLTEGVETKRPAEMKEPGL